MRTSPRSGSLSGPVSISCCYSVFRFGCRLRTSRYGEPRKPDTTTDRSLLRQIERRGWNLNVLLEFLPAGVHDCFVRTRRNAFDREIPFSIRNRRIRAGRRDNLREHAGMDVAAHVVEAVARKRKDVLLPCWNRDVEGR